MQIDFNRVLSQFDGRPVFIPDEVDDKGKPITVKPATLAAVCIDALLGQVQGEPPLTSVKTMERYTLAQTIFMATDLVEVTATQISEIESLLPKRWAPLVAGQAVVILEAAKHDA